MCDCRAVSKVLARMHDASAAAAAANADKGPCPVFATSCPFKTAVCSDGRPLLDEMEYNT